MLPGEVQPGCRKHTRTGRSPPSAPGVASCGVCRLQQVGEAGKPHSEEGDFGLDPTALTLQLDCTTCMRLPESMATSCGAVVRVLDQDLGEESLNLCSAMEAHGDLGQSYPLSLTHPTGAL